MKTYKLLQPLILTSLLWIGSSDLLGQQAKNIVLASFMSTETLYGQPSFPYSTPRFRLAIFGVGLITAENLPWSVWQARL
jgi:hypothetical protein